MTDARKRKDPDYLAAGDNLYAWLQGLVTDIVTDRLGAPTEREQEIIAIRAEYAAKHWQIDYVDCARGRDQAEIARLSSGAVWTPTASRQVAQRVTVTSGHEADVHAIARAIIEVVPQGADPCDFKPAVIKKLKDRLPDQRTYDNFKEAVTYAAALSATVHREKAAVTQSDIRTADQVEAYPRLGAIVLPSPCPSSDQVPVAKAPRSFSRGVKQPAGVPFPAKLESFPVCCSSTDQGLNAKGAELSLARRLPKVGGLQESIFYPFLPSG